MTKGTWGTCMLIALLSASGCGDDGDTGPDVAAGAGGTGGASGAAGTGGSSGASGGGGTGGLAGTGGSSGVGGSGGVCTGQQVSHVEGTATHGALVTIRGCGFGSKPTAAPLLWDTFEQGALGAHLENANAVIGTWESGSAADGPVYSDTVAHGGSQSSHHDFVSNYAANLCKNGTFPRIYLDYWMLADYVTIKTRNFKPWRFYGDNDDMQMNPVWFCEGNGGGFSLYHGESLEMNWNFPGYSEEEWLHFQLVFQESSPNVADGTVRHTINHETAGPDSDTVVTRLNGTSFDQIRIGHYWAQDGVPGCEENPGAHVYVDDVYIDTSWARVELGDAPTYDACTHREMQIPETWEDEAVDVTVNRGSFAVGQDVYLFVTDASGATTAGFPIRVSP